MLISDTVQKQAADDPVIFDVGTEDFEARVIMASMERPVIVQFWAPWCGPCKQLSPLLEKAVKAASGAVVMARINLDENQELAAAMQIQSVPIVYAFFQGRPVDAFQGLLPPAQVQGFIDKIAKMSEAAATGGPDMDVPGMLTAAAAALSEGNLAEAQNHYAQILSADQNNAAAYAGMIRILIAAGQLEKAESYVEAAPEAIQKTPEFDQACTALELAQDTPGEPLAALAEAVQKNPKDHQAKLDLARAQFAAGQKQEALDNLLESIRMDRDWDGQAARKQLLKFFEALGHADPLTVQGRKTLSSILFS